MIQQQQERPAIHLNSVCQLIAFMHSRTTLLACLTSTDASLVEGGKRIHTAGPGSDSLQCKDYYPHLHILSGTPSVCLDSLSHLIYEGSCISENIVEPS